eukprot:674936-Prymnesium_polylepis.4
MELVAQLRHLVAVGLGALHIRHAPVYGGEPFGQFKDCRLQRVHCHRWQVALACLLGQLSRASLRPSALKPLEPAVESDVHQAAEDAAKRIAHQLFSFLSVRLDHVAPRVEDEVLQITGQDMHQTGHCHAHTCAVRVRVRVCVWGEWRPWDTLVASARPEMRATTLSVIFLRSSLSPDVSAAHA